MRALDQNGFHLGRIGFGLSETVRHTKDLLKEPAYLSIVESLSEDLDELQKKHPQLSIRMNTGYRLFDQAWLRSEHSNFELVGIVNRLDRAPFHSKSCGEFRFIYRLAYTKTTRSGLVYSRLPMTLNVVYRANSEQGCRATTKRWKAFVAKASHKPKKATLDLLLPAELNSIEVNLQSVRWPSTMRPDMGGYAEYFLRVYQRDNEVFKLSPLENTPDVVALTKSPKHKKKLLEWLKKPSQLSSLDQGVLQIPETFLARKSDSVALSGPHRLANSPFSQVFEESDFADLNLKNFKTIKSPHGLIKRLNDHSCMGCHQGQSVAGFHFLGEDDPQTAAANSILVSSSTHFMRDQPRRLEYFRAIQKSRTPPEFRAMSVRAENDPGGWGSHCGLGDPSFESWSCQPGFECVAVTLDSQISQTGICMPIEPVAGSVCQVGPIQHHRNPHLDRVRLSNLSCGFGQHCEVSRVGFPGGMCSKPCSNLRPGEVCGSIAILAGFNSCLASEKKAFSDCLEENVRPAALRACGPKQPCRADYICSRLATGEGACIPPYFLFQLRVDGHPKP